MVCLFAQSLKLLFAIASGQFNGVLQADAFAGYNVFGGTDSNGKHAAAITHH